MCYHRYTHFANCATHIPLHTNACPKNVEGEASRVIFCADYKAIQFVSDQACPFCSPSTSVGRVKSPRGIMEGKSGGQEAYPSPKRTASPWVSLGVEAVGPGICVRGGQTPCSFSGFHCSDPQLELRRLEAALRSVLPWGCGAV